MGNGVSVLIGGFPGWVGFRVRTEVFFEVDEGVVDGEEGLEGCLTGRKTKSPDLRFE